MRPTNPLRLPVKLWALTTALLCVTAALPAAVLILGAPEAGAVVFAAIFSFVLAAASSTAFWYLYRRTFMPLVQLEEGARKMVKGETSFVELKGPPEIVWLTAHVNLLARMRKVRRARAKRNGPLLADIQIQFRPASTGLWTRSDSPSKHTEVN